MDTSVDTVYSPQQVAHRLNISRRYVYLLIHEGRLPAFKIGRCVRISADALAAFLADAPAA